MQRLRRIVRYLWVTKDMGMYIENGGGIHSLTAIADADWAGNKQTRRSNSCGVIVVSGVVQHFVARGQAAVALSSAESEVYAATTAAAEALHVQHVWAWAGFPMRLRLLSDSSAARSILQRVGVGRVRHISVRILWMQSLTSSGRLVVGKVLGTENVADGGTKPLATTPFEQFRERLGLRAMPPGLVAGLLLLQMGAARAAREDDDEPDEKDDGGFLFLVVRLGVVLFSLGVMFGTVVGWWAARWWAESRWRRLVASTAGKAESGEKRSGGEQRRDRGAQTESMVVFASGGGGRYHRRPNCSGLREAVRQVRCLTLCRLCEEKGLS
jgi:hypothetical protein